MSAYDDAVRAAALRYGVPPDLAIAQMNAESSGDPNARSPVGAVGLFQLMPATAVELGVDPYDPYQNIDGGMRYLRQQYDRFGSWDLALAGYHSGAGNVQAGNLGPAAVAYVNRILSAIGLSPQDPTMARLILASRQPGRPLKPPIRRV